MNRDFIDLSWIMLSFTLIIPSTGSNAVIVIPYVVLQELDFIKDSYKKTCTHSVVYRLYILKKTKFEPHFENTGSNNFG